MSETAADATAPTLVGISFSDAFRAEEFLAAATRPVANGRLRLRDAVFVGRDDSGTTVVRETLDPAPGRSSYPVRYGRAWSA